MINFFWGGEVDFTPTKVLLNYIEKNTPKN